MPDRLYIQPLTFSPSPQVFAGDAVRLAGGMVYAREFAVILRRDGQVVERALATMSPRWLRWIVSPRENIVGPANLVSATL